jgi:acyl-CoA reductase-like NAD-dependent aldehyde dehydrogenase
VDIGDYESLCNREIFGPVVAVVAASGIDDALAKANTGRYGLSFSIYTRDLELARHFVAAVDAGICHVNMPTGYRHNALPVSGRKESGRGLPECGTYARDFFSQPKAVYGLYEYREQQ